MVAATRFHRRCAFPVEALFFCSLLLIPVQAVRDPEQHAVAIYADVPPGEDSRRGVQTQYLQHYQKDRLAKLQASLLNQTTATADPAVLITCYGLTVLADIANVVLHAVRVSRLGQLRDDLQSVQENIFNGRFDACFSVRSLELQADLLTRGMDAYILFSATMAGGASPKATETAKDLVAALQAVNKHLRASMLSSVQHACHSMSSGEVILQANINEVTALLKKAQQDMLSAGLDLVNDVAVGVIGTYNLESPGHAHAVAEVTTVETEFIESARLLTGAEALPPGMTTERREFLVKILGTIYKVAVGAAYSAGALRSDVSGLLASVLGFVKAVVKLFLEWKASENQKKGALYVTITIFELVNNALGVVKSIMTAVGGSANPFVVYSNAILGTLKAYLKLTQTALQLQLEGQQRVRMLSEAAVAQIESALVRSYGTCSDLGMAWGWAGEAAKMVQRVDELQKLPGSGFGAVTERARGELLETVYTTYYKQRPAMAAKFLQQAYKEKHEGVTWAMVQQARKLARAAPITDFAVAGNPQQEEAMKALGFELEPCAGKRRARLLVCRGCGESVIVGMGVVTDKEAERKMSGDFGGTPPRFETDSFTLALPPDATLNFVQLPQEEGFQMLAFVKVPLSAAIARSLPILFELREEFYTIEAETTLHKQTAIDFQNNALKFMKDNGAVVLSWRPSVTKVGFTDRISNALDVTVGPFDTRRYEFGQLDALVGHFLDVSASDLSQGLAGVIPTSTLQNFTHVTVTKGCGCSMGKLGNRFRAGSPNIVLLHSVAYDLRQKQPLRCVRRLDVLLSDGEITDEMVTASSGSDDLGLNCKIAGASVALPGGVDDPRRMAVFDLRASGDEDGNFAGVKIFDVDVYNAATADKEMVLSYDVVVENKKVKMDVPIQVINRYGFMMPATIEIWRGEEDRPVQRSAPSVAVQAWKPIQHFQARLKEELCSERCAIVGDVASVPEAIKQVTNVDVSKDPIRSSAKLENRGTTCATKTAEDETRLRTLLATFQWFFPLPADSPSTSGKPPAALSDAVDAIYKNNCQFQALLVKNLAPCDNPSEVGDLLITKHVEQTPLSGENMGIVTEICRPRSLEPPVKQYIVSLDFDHHGKNLAILNTREREVEAQLVGAGFLPWGSPVLWSSKGKWEKDIVLKERTLRQRIFVQWDPRVAVAPEFTCLLSLREALALA